MLLHLIEKAQAQAYCWIPFKSQNEGLQSQLRTKPIFRGSESIWVVFLRRKFFPELLKYLGHSREFMWILYQGSFLIPYFYLANQHRTLKTICFKNHFCSLQGTAPHAHSSCCKINCTRALIFFGRIAQVSDRYECACREDTGGWDLCVSSLAPTIPVHTLPSSPFTSCSLFNLKSEWEKCVLRKWRCKSLRQKSMYVFLFKDLLVEEAVVSRFSV